MPAPTADYDLLRQHLLARVPLTKADFTGSYLKPRTVAKAQQLLLAGKVCTQLAFAIQGCLRDYSVDEKEHTHTLQFSLPSWWVSDSYNFLTGQPSPTSIDAQEEASQVLLRPILRRCS